MNRNLLVFLCVLFFFFFYETELGVSRTLGSLHKVDRDKRPGSQLPLHLLCTLECPNFSDTHGIQLCLCLLHRQVQQKQTSGKLFPLCPVPFSETSMKMETSLVKVIDDPFFVKLNSHISVLILLDPPTALAIADHFLFHETNIPFGF